MLLFNFIPNIVAVQTLKAIGASYTLNCMLRNHVLPTNVIMLNCYNEACYLTCIFVQQHFLTMHNQLDSLSAVVSGMTSAPCEALDSTTGRVAKRGLLGTLAIAGLLTALRSAGTDA